MPLGAFLPTRAFAQDPAAIRDWTQAVEEIGYDYIDVPDHVLGVDRQARPDFDGPMIFPTGSTKPSSPWVTWRQSRHGYACAAPS